MVLENHLSRKYFKELQAALCFLCPPTIEEVLSHQYGLDHYTLTRVSMKMFTES